MLSVAIVEDDIKYSRLLEGFIDKYGKEQGENFKISVFDDGLKFLMAQPDGGGFNIVFMDIELPKLDGLKTARKLRAVDKNASLIFCTNMAKHAVNGYEVDALDFLVKPVEYFNFSLKLEKAVRIQKKLMDDVIMVDGADGLVKLKISEICFVESNLHNIIWHLENGEVRSRSSMKETEKQLEGRSFARCNNSFLVNLAFVDKTFGDTVVVGGTELSVSRSRKKSFLDSLAVYYGGSI